MKWNKLFAPTIVSILLIGGAAASLAQQPAGGQDEAPGMGMMGQGGMMGRGRLMMPGMMGADCPMMGMMRQGGEMPTFIEGRLAFLKTELAITDAQKDAWSAYADALRKNLEGMQNMRKSMMKATEAKSPVERLDAHITAMEGRLNALREVKPALATLYAGLSTDQKTKADQLLTGMGCMM